MKMYEIVFAITLFLILCICIYNNSNKSFFTSKKGTCGIGRPIESFDIGGEMHDNDHEDHHDEDTDHNEDTDHDEDDVDPFGNHTDHDEGFSVGCQSCGSSNNSSNTTKTSDTYNIQDTFDVGGPFLTGGKTCTVTMIWADWCGYSKKAKPQWDNLSEEFEGTDISGYKLKFNTIEEKEYKEDKELINKFNVEGFPTFYVELSDKDKMVDFNSIEKDDMYNKIKESVNNILGNSEQPEKQPSRPPPIPPPKPPPRECGQDNSYQVHSSEDTHHTTLGFAPVALALEGSQMIMPSQKQLQLPGIDAVQGVPESYL